MSNGGPGFYRGTTHDQMPFFKNKEAKMMESAAWPEEFSTPVDIDRVNVEVIRQWVQKRIAELLEEDDEILVDYCMQQLAEHADVDGNVVKLCPKRLQINLTGFMGKHTATFVKELWSNLLSAQEDPTGIPAHLAVMRHEQQLAKAREAARARAEMDRLARAAERLKAAQADAAAPPNPVNTSSAPKVMDLQTDSSPPHRDAS
eukprot:Polyplicarium_translucidae@DN3469_c0_g1_i1.p1